MHKNWQAEEISLVMAQNQFTYRVSAKYRYRLHKCVPISIPPAPVLLPAVVQPWHRRPLPPWPCHAQATTRR